MRAHVVPSLGKVVFSEEDIARAVARLGAEIRDRNNGLPLLMIGVLKGALPFAADLMRALGE